MLKRSLHNSTFRGRKQPIFSVFSTIQRSIELDRSQDCRSNFKKVNFPFCILKIRLKIDVCRRRHNKLKLLRSKNQLCMMIRPCFSNQNVINISVFQPKSILNTDLESSRRVENVFDTPGLWKYLFWGVVNVLLQKIENQKNLKNIFLTPCSKSLKKAISDAQNVVFNIFQKIINSYFLENMCSYILFIIIIIFFTFL